MLVCVDRPGADVSTESRSWTVTTDDGRSVAVFVLDDGTLRVTDAACPHRGGPLAEGRLRPAGDAAPDATITCPWHWYRFSLESGRCLTVPCDALGHHPVVERDGVRYAELPEPTPPMSWSERLRAHARDPGDQRPQ